jgi:long-chain fatty acid transport protein
MNRTLRPALPATLLALTLVALAPRASASGFQLREQSPSAQGNSFAGISAGGSDIGSMFFNPATLTLFSGHEAVLGGSLVQPSAKLSDGSATGAAAMGSFPIGGEKATGNAAHGAVLPNLYAMYSVTKDLKLGFSVNVPFGLVTNYDSSWIGRYHAIRSDLKTLDLAPTVAWRLSPMWSVGAAFVARKADADLSNGVDFGAILYAMTHGQAGAPGHSDSIARLQGSAWAYGYKAGILFQPCASFRVGLGYQAPMDMKLKGTVSYSGNPVPAPLAAAGFRDGGIHADLNLPGTTSLGCYWQVCSPFALQAEVARTSWSRFKELRVRFETTPTDNVTEEKWEDTTFMSLGGTWKASPALTVRAGVAHDSAPVTDQYRTPRIPDSDRTWVSAGLGYALTSQVSVDLGYSHLFAKDAPMHLTDGGASSSPNFFRGNLNGTFKDSVDVLTVQARLTF